MDDYAVDRRGDVGSWVREESMVSLTFFVKNLIDNESQHPEAISLLKADGAHFFERFVGALLQQLVEKIDKTREVAGRHLQIFFKFTAPKICQFAEKDALTALFT